MNLESRSTSWKVKNSLWILLSFVFLLHWTSILYAALKVKNKMWFSIATLFAIPVFVFMVMSKPSTGAAYTFGENMMMGSFFLSWAASIFMSFYIRKEYLQLLAERYPNEGLVDNFNEFSGSAFNSNASTLHRSELKEVFEIRRDIFEMLSKREINKNDMFQEIVPLVERFIENVKELLFRDDQLIEIIEANSSLSYEEKIKELESKMELTENFELKRQYEQNLEKYKQQFKSFVTLRDEQEIVKLKIDSSLISLRQIKIDLLKMSGMENESISKEFFESIELKSQELNGYVNYFKENIEYLK